MLYPVALDIVLSIYLLGCVSLYDAENNSNVGVPIAYSAFVPAYMLQTLVSNKNAVATHAPLPLPIIRII